MQTYSTNIIKNMNNPFVITGNIPERYFCDRRDEAAKIIRTVVNNGNLCLMSPRRMGKSKLITFCYGRKELANTHYTFYIDILHTTSIREFAYVFGQKVFDTLHSTSKKNVYHTRAGAEVYQRPLRL